MQFNCADFNVSQTRSSRTSWKKKKVFVKSSSLSTFGVWGYNFGEKSEDFFITSCWVCVAKVVSIETSKAPAASGRQAYVARRHHMPARLLSSCCGGFGNGEINYSQMKLILSSWTPLSCGTMPKPFIFCRVGGGTVHKKKRLPPHYAQTWT